MIDLNERISELYEQFKDFPTKNKIVRINQKDDAFELVVFEILFQNLHGIKKLNFNEEAHREIVLKSIVPAPDDSVDIFFEEEDLDDRKYHIVQVKNSDLDPQKIEDLFILMENSIKKFLRKPRDTEKNLKDIINETDFSKQYINDCIYYVVHRGRTNYIKGQKSNQKVITGNELEILEKGTEQMSVPREFFEIDTKNNFIVNNFIDTVTAKVNTNIPQSLLCNFSGYDLAKLNNKYSNTLLGRNILYGQNLRESLSKNSKTYESMFETINKEPELFLFYNNGITIIASSTNAIEKDTEKEMIQIENFSIINGAQTTSTLGAYLKDAEINNELEKIENLKKVFVLTKIYEINQDLKNHKAISENIKIYNNTQTPLSSRDMVSIRKEQIDLKNRLLMGESPNIFVFIKKGEGVPSYPKSLPYQRVSNETLAQLAFCAFYFEPFTAKDKKTSLFDNDGKEDVILNYDYNRLFNPNNGILFVKSKKEIDELLFIYLLHQKRQKSFIKEELNVLNQRHLNNPEQEKRKEEQIDAKKRSLEISNVCLFYNITCYYIIKSNYDYLIENVETSSFSVRRYFDSSDSYKQEIIRAFIKLFYTKTIDIIRKNTGVENITNWIRAEKNQKTFIDSLNDILNTDGFNLSQDYIDFVKKFRS